MEILEKFMSGDQVEMWEAAKTLAAERNPDLAPRLLEIMESSPDTQRRVAAAWILGFLHSSDALESMIRILDDESQPAALRDHAAEALGHISDSRARDVLIRNLFDKDPDISFSCAFALRTVGTTKDIFHLEQLAANSSLVNSYGASVAQEAREAADQIRKRETPDEPKQA